jgi:O-antigen ligase
VLGILFSLSRAGWIDSLVSLLVLATLILFPRTSSTTGRAAIFSGLAVLVLAAFLIASPDAMLGRLVGTVTTDSNGRLFIWHQLMPLLHDFRWFGTGLMGFDPVFLKYQNFVNQARIDFAHNDFLQYLIEMGIIGFVPTLIALGVIVWPVTRDSWFASGKPEIRVLLAGCAASFTALFLHSLVDFNLYIPANVFAFAWILGFGSALTRLRYTRGEETAYAHPHTKHD